MENDHMLNHAQARKNRRNMGNSRRQGVGTQLTHNDLIRGIIALPDETDSFKLFLIAMIIDGDRDGQNIYPGRKRIAHLMHKGIATISRFLSYASGKYLIEDGKGPDERGRNYNTKYKAMVPGVTPNYLDSKITSISQHLPATTGADISQQETQRIPTVQARAVGQTHWPTRAPQLAAARPQPGRSLEQTTGPITGPIVEMSPVRPAYAPIDVEVKRLVSMRINHEHGAPWEMTLKSLKRYGIDEQYFKKFCQLTWEEHGINEELALFIFQTPIEQWGDLTFAAPEEEPAPATPEKEPETMTEDEYPF